MRFATLSMRSGFAGIIIQSIFSTICMQALAAEPGFESVTKRERKDLIRRAQVWIGDEEWVRKIPELDLVAGPQGKGGFAPFEEVSCSFVFGKGGWKPTAQTPKFYCSRGDDEFKVKYGEENREVCGEILGTRLLWALGYPADRIYPVAVDCPDCPRDPFVYNSQNQAGRVARASDPRTGARFDRAIVERKFPGHEIYTDEDHEGIGLDELKHIDPSAGGAPREQVESILVLAAFIGHLDNKAANQRLLCPKKEASVDPVTRRPVCGRPIAMIQDAGGIFGTRGRFYRLYRNQKVDLGAWSGARLFRSRRGCRLNLPSIRGSRSIVNPRVHDEGRRFLARLMNRLTDRQIRDLFETARVTECDRGSTVDGWVQAFKEKREQLNEACGS